MAVQSSWGARGGGPTPGMVIRPTASIKPARFVAHDPELLEVLVSRLCHDKPRP